MKAARVAVLACPDCGGALGPAASTGFLDCPSCGSPLAVRSPEAAARYAVAPRIGRDEALRIARGCWEKPPVLPSFLVGGRIEPPRLLYVSFYEVERTGTFESPGKHVVFETLDHVPATEIHGVEPALLDGVVFRDHQALRAFDPTELQREGLVFDPSRGVGEAAPHDPRMHVLEERIAIVYAPLWVLRCRHGRNLYEVSVDATTGSVLRGRAPAERTARLPQAIGALYALGLAIALVIAAGSDGLRLLLGMREAGLFVGFLLLAGLAGLAAWAWDRVRFRYEVVMQKDARRLAAINRPARTAPERVRDGLFAVALKMLEGRRGRWWR